MIEFLSLSIWTSANNYKYKKMLSQWLGKWTKSLYQNQMSLEATFFIKELLFLLHWKWWVRNVGISNTFVGCNAMIIFFRLETWKNGMKKYAIVVHSTLIFLSEFNTSVSFIGKMYVLQKPQLFLHCMKMFYIIFNFSKKLFR